MITDIKEVKVAGKGTGIGAVAGGVAGIIVGNQIGSGTGTTIAKIAGAAGGAYVGNKVEQKVRAETHYDISVKLDNGETLTLSQDAQPTLAVGANVRVVDGAVVAR
jgi:outer membrane lipoprotein SlyB